MKDCLFCRISSKTISAKIIYEDPDAVVFEDISPQAPVHVLIVPRKHIPTALDIADEDKPLIGHMFRIASRIADEKGIAESGFRLLMNTNAHAGQSVYHIHLHLLGGRQMHWPPG